jgi:hypothetical protein
MVGAVFGLLLTFFLLLSLFSLFIVVMSFTFLVLLLVRVSRLLTCGQILGNVAVVLVLLVFLFVLTRWR